MKHMARVILIAFCLQLLAACAQTQGPGTVRKQDVGMVGGAIGGAIAGQAIGGSDPTARILGTVAGVIVGAAVGGYLGSLWDDYDRRQVSYSLENTQDYKPSTWKNPNTNNQYSFTPVKTYYDDAGTPCREFTQTIYVDGKKETGRGTACRQPDGTWHIVNSQ